MVGTLGLFEVNTDAKPQLSSLNRRKIWVKTESHNPKKHNIHANKKKIFLSSEHIYALNLAFTKMSKWEFSIFNRDPALPSQKCQKGNFPSLIETLILKNVKNVKMGIFHL